MSVYKRYNWKVIETLNTGYLNPEILPEAANEILLTLKTLKLVPPFKLLDIPAEEKRIKELLSEDNGSRICEYFRIRAKIGEMQSRHAPLDMLPSEFDKEFFAECSNIVEDILSTLRFYDSIGNDMQAVFNGLLKFIGNLENAIRLDEEHLLPIAGSIFGNRQVLTQTDYVALQNGKRTVMVRRVQFADYYSFILTDFYEGLHYGHYPRRCPICKQYFLMQDARR